MDFDLGVIFLFLLNLPSLRAWAKAPRILFFWKLVKLSRLGSEIAMDLRYD